MKNFHVSSGIIDAERSKSENLSGSDIVSRCHDRYEILYVIDGKGKCVIEGVEYPIKPRCLFIFAPLVYRAIYPEEGSTFDRASVSFDEKSVSESVRDMLTVFGSSEDKLPPVVFYGADGVSDQIAALIERFEAAEFYPEPKKNKFLGLLISELILLISMAGGEGGGYDESELGARVIRYLNENCKRDISLEQLARRFFVSKYHLCRAFKKHNGISVHGYMNRKRIMYAKQLIEAGETASRAAYQVGFGDYSAFYRAYVKIVGKAPTANENVERGIR